MTSQDIRRGFLNYFKSQGHTIVPSSPVVPLNDPTLLFTNAGMNQFKDVFLGKDKRPFTRATTTQKCIRAGGKHNDLENVGHTSRHCTFFEMLGNFSFGDYFKKEAIGFAYDVATRIFGFDHDKIWITVFKDDDEAIALWEKHIPLKRIVRLGEKDNFWAMGDIGPCGPCSELLYDRGEKFSSATSPQDDISGERFFEFWNLVFMQYNKNAQGKMDPLPQKCIDTGAGLERLVGLKMNVNSVFQTDILRSLIAEVENISKIKYDPNNFTIAPSFHVIADHIRSLSFAIADGAIPSNTDRGYILRKILRRAFRYGKILKLETPFLSLIVSRLTKLMGDDFPELKLAQNKIEEILFLEEENFIKTLKRGGHLLNQVMQRSTTEISANDVFMLKDTYGFPTEEILLIAKDNNLKVDLSKVNILEEEAKEKSKKAQKTSLESFEKNIFLDFSKTHKPSTFTGYDNTHDNAHIIAIVKDGQFTDSISEGEEAMIILDKTPFYAEKGGQVADTGFIQKGGNNFDVIDCQLFFGTIIAHIGKMKTGNFKKQDKVEAIVDTKKRTSICNNHTATHLLHWALGQVLSKDVRQAGSLVEEKRLRFDFNYHKALTLEEIRQIEHLVNEKIRENHVVKIYELTLDEARKKEEIKQFFGEKYEEKVRVIDIEFSKELCGGTHTKMLGTIGLFRIEKEMSIAAGVRRIEAVSGKAAEDFMYAKENILLSCATLLKSSVDKLQTRVETVLEEEKNLKESLKKLSSLQNKQLIQELVKKTEKIGPFSILMAEISLDSKQLVAFANELMGQLTSAIIILSLITDKRRQIIVKISSDITSKIEANVLLNTLLSSIDGKGGGNKELAQGSGNDTPIEPIFAKARKIIKDIK
jgi:alanyl-tRNA synthetase